MEFEPFRNLSFLDYFGNAILWGGITAAIFAFVTFLLCFFTKDKDIKQALQVVSVFGLATGVFISTCVLEIDKDRDNHRIALNNVSKKYDVQVLVLEKGHRGGLISPDTDKPLNATIKANGKTRPAVITQNLDTFEPTLTDVDTGKHMDDILHK